MASKLLEEVKKLSVVELVNFIKEIQDEFGISLSTAAPSVVTGAQEAESAPVVEEKVEFKVTLKELGGEKIKVIKALRAVVDKTLKEVRDLVESVPSVIVESASKEDAEKIKKALEESGAKVELS